MGKVSDKKIINETIDSIYKNSERPDDLVDLLITTAVLLNELESGRFRGAEYCKRLKLDRLTVEIRLDKYAPSI